MIATYAESTAVSMLAAASSQKSGTQVVTTSIRCVEPQATMKSAKPMRNQAQSRAMTRRVRWARISRVTQMVT